MSKETEDLNADMTAMSDLISQMSKKFSKISDSSLDMEKQIEKMNVSLKSSNKQASVLTDKFEDLKDTAQEIAGIFGVAATFIGLAEAAENAARMDKDFTKMGYQLGKGAVGAKELYNSATGLEKELGASADDAQIIVSSLANGRFTGDIKTMSKSVYSMADATGMSAQSVSDFALSLSHGAQLSQKSVTSIMASMTKVQYTVGLSQSGMEAVSESVQESASNMTALGKTSQSIKVMAANTTALAASLEKVGLSAQWTTSQIEKLTDPDRLEENIGLYSQLGISIEDAMNGDITKQFGEGLKDMAERAKSMGPLAGAAYAKTFGMTYKDLMKATQADVAKGQAKASEAVQSPEEKSAEALEKMSKMSDSVSAKIEKGINKINGMIAGLGPVILVIGAIISKLIHNTMSSLRTDAKKSASVAAEAIAASAAMGAEKAKKIHQEQLSDYIKSEKAYSGEESKNYVAQFKRRMKEIEAIGQSTKAGVGLKMAEADLAEIVHSTSEWHPFLRAAESNTFAIANGFEKGVKATKMQLEALEQEKLTISKNNGMTEEQANDYNNLIKLQEKMKANGQKLNSEEFSRLKAYEEIKKANETNVASIDTEIAKIKQTKIGVMEVANISQELSTQQKELIELNKVKNSMMKEVYTTQYDLADINKKILEKETQISDTKAKQGSFNKLSKHAQVEVLNMEKQEQQSIIDSQKAMAEKVKKQQEEFDAAKALADKKSAAAITDKKNAYLSETEKINIQLAADAEQAKVKSMKEALEKSQKELDTNTAAANLAQKNVDYINDQTTALEKAITRQGRMEKLADGLKDGLNRVGKGMKQNLLDPLKKAETGFVNLTKKAADVAKHPLKFAKEKFSASVETEGGGAKGVAKILGKMSGALGVVAVVMKILGPLIDKIKEPIEEIFNQIIGFLMPALEPLLPIVMTLVKFLVKMFLPPILRLLAFVLPKTLQFVVSVLMGIMMAINWIKAKLFHDNAAAEQLKDLKSQYSDMMEQIKEVGPQLTKAAENIEKSSFETAKTNKDMAEDESATVYEANGSGFDKIANGTSTTNTTVDSSAASTSNGTDAQTQTAKATQNTADATKDVAEASQNSNIMLAQLQIEMSKMNENMNMVGAFFKNWFGETGDLQRWPFRAVKEDV